MVQQNVNFDILGNQDNDQGYHGDVVYRCHDLVWIVQKSGSQIAALRGAEVYVNSVAVFETSIPCS